MSVTANFKDPDNGEGVYVSSYITRYNDITKKFEYFINGNIPLVNSNDNPLISIPKDQQQQEATTTIIGGLAVGESSAQYNKKIAYLKDRAHKHAISPEGKQLRFEAEKREYKSMGLEKK